MNDGIIEAEFTVALLKVLPFMSLHVCCFHRNCGVSIETLPAGMIYSNFE